MNNSKCKTYSESNKCCRLNYDNPFKIPIDEQIKNCNGLSNETICSWFKSIYINESMSTMERKKLRKMKKEIGL